MSLVDDVLAKILGKGGQNSGSTRAPSEQAALEQRAAEGLANGIMRGLSQSDVAGIHSTLHVSKVEPNPDAPAVVVRPNPDAKPSGFTVTPQKPTEPWLMDVQPHATRDDVAAAITGNAALKDHAVRSYEAAMRDRTSGGQDRTTRVR